MGRGFLLFIAKIPPNFPTPMSEKAPTLTINEIYESIQGESTWAGWRCVFVRLTFCDLRCTYCDTEYAFYKGTKRPVAEVLDELLKHETPLVEITGGEPLLQKNVLPLMAARSTQYGKGTLVEPNAEQPAASFLGKRKTFELSTPAQRTATIRTLLRLMDAAGVEMVEVSKVNSPTSRLRLNDLRNLVKTTAGSLSVISELSQKPALQEFARKVAGYGGATPVAEYRQGIADLSAAFVKEMPDTRPASTQPTAAAP